MNGLGSRYDVWRTAAPEDDDPDDAPTTTVVVEPDPALVSLVDAAREMCATWVAWKRSRVPMWHVDTARDKLFDALAPFDPKEETDA